MCDLTLYSSVPTNAANLEASNNTIEAPEWFKRAVATPREDRVVNVEDCPIHYLRWGDPARRWFRISAHAYNFPGEYGRLADALGAASRSAKDSPNLTDATGGAPG